MRLEGGSAPVSLPPTDGPAPQLEPVKVAEVNAELEELKKSIDTL